MSSQSVRVIESTAYGKIEVNDSHIFHFPKGIFGFDGLHDYVMMQVGDGPFHVLHALDEQISFILLPASLAADDYGFHIGQSVIDMLEIARPEDVLTYVIVNVIDNQIYVNLKAPIIINTINRKAAQHIIDDASYPLRHPLSIREGS